MEITEKNLLELENLKKIEKIACDVAIKAGIAIMEIYENEELFKNVKIKSDNSPLTLADSKSNDIIIKVLEEKFPNFAILSEEGKDDLSRLKNSICFIIDPLDGTKEFIKRNGQFTVNIGLSYNNKTILGVIYVPFTKELYFASKDNGSFYTNSLGKTIKIQVSNITNSKEIRFVMSGSHGAPEMDEIMKNYSANECLKIGSSLKGCLVAKGDAEVYFRHNPTMEWDTCAMHCIAEEAGGIFKQMDGSEMLYNRENSLNDKGFYIINSNKNKLV